MAKLMQTITAQNKRFIKWYLLIVVVILSVLSAVTCSPSYSPNGNGLILHDYDKCGIKEYMRLANELNIAYTLIYDRNSIGLRVDHADKQAIKDLQTRHQDYRERQGNLSDDIATVEIETVEKEACHLQDVKTHVENVNPKLLPFIPDDVDHVSYHPNPDGDDNKAVYCHYLAGEKGGSQCYFIHLLADRLVRDDISDMERANIVQINQFYRLRQDPDNLRLVRSWVVDWESRPHKLYGFTLQTSYQGNPWGVIERF